MTAETPNIERPTTEGIILLLVLVIVIAIGDLEGRLSNRRLGCHSAAKNPPIPPDTLDYEHDHGYEHEILHSTFGVRRSAFGVSAVGDRRYSVGRFPFCCNAWSYPITSLPANSRLVNVSVIDETN